MNWKTQSDQPEHAASDWPTNPKDVANDEYLLAFVLTGDATETLPARICGVQVSPGRAVEDDRPYLEACMKSGVPEAWFNPGFNSLTVRVKASDRGAAVRAGWEHVRPGSRYLSTYIRPPRPGFDLQQQRVIAPTGWVMVSHQQAMTLVSYHTWILMTIAISGQPGQIEERYNKELFVRLADLSNRFWIMTKSIEDKIRVERSVTWYGRSLSAGDYATTLLTGWMATVPIVIAARDPSGAMLDRLQAIAERHEYPVDRTFLDALRDARNEIAHEASMANADPLAVDAAQVSGFLHPLRMLFLMSLLFVLESEPTGGPILDKWATVREYKPSVLINDDTAPFWYPVPEIFGTCE
jgi:hypothetical protein